ncbi:MAG TPA: trypsin-like peptidase domain-containing protein, partial [Terricaulis sp.]|nr:trypsin-like peptidase domain-containing protein [Terricaulis sp.]
MRKARKRPVAPGARIPTYRLMFHRKLTIDAQPARRPRDGFSETIMRVVAAAGPSVIGVRRSARGRDLYDGAGSGVIISPDGYALTNHHVVRGAGRVEAMLHDGAMERADIVGVDPDTDLALLRLDGAGHRAGALGDSDALAVGELAVA